MQTLPTSQGSELQPDSHCIRLAHRNKGRNPQFRPKHPPGQPLRNAHSDTSGPVNSGWHTVGVSVGTHFFGW